MSLISLYTTYLSTADLFSEEPPLPGNQPKGVGASAERTITRTAQAALSACSALRFPAYQPGGSFQRHSSGLCALRASYDAGDGRFSQIDRTIRGLCPDYSPFNRRSTCDTPEEGWVRAIQEHSPGFALKHQKTLQVSARNVYQLQGASESFVVKQEFEALQTRRLDQEQAGCALLRALDLKELKVPKPLSLTENTTLGIRYLIKAYIPGETFTHLFQSLSQKPSARGHLLEELRRGSYQAGKGFGELHAKSQGDPRVCPVEFVKTNGIIDVFNQPCLFGGFGALDPQALIQDCCDMLRPHGFRLKDKFFDDFQRSPGKFCYGLNDIQFSNFVWDGRSCGFIDGEFINSHALAAKEFYAFSASLEIAGVQVGLSHKERTALRARFREGYLADHPDPISQEAHTFFEVYSSLHVLQALYSLGLQQDIALEEQKIRTLLQPYVSSSV